MSTWTAALLARLDWALTRAAAPCPPLSASGQMEHTRATATIPRFVPPWTHQSAMKGRG